MLFLKKKLSYNYANSWLKEKDIWQIFYNVRQLNNFEFLLFYKKIIVYYYLQWTNKKYYLMKPSDNL